MFVVNEMALEVYRAWSVMGRPVAAGSRGVDGRIYGSPKPIYTTLKRGIVQSQGQVFS